MQEIERLNAETRGPEQYRARYGPTRLSDMSREEYKDIHLSDEKLAKAPSAYGKSWGRRADKDRYDVDGSQADIQKNHSSAVESHDNIYIVINRNKRAVLPMQFDW